ncbi:MAG: Ig-like domain-containing protein, partial [Gammaproteobacteria bacterium]
DATTVTYKPDPGFYGSDIVTYAITDGRPGGSASARVVVTVTRKPNTRPTAVNDRLNVEQDSGGHAVAVLSNDKDADGDPLKVNSVRASHGSVTTNGTTVTYTPNRGYHGGDTIAYSITDGRGGTATGSVAVTVTQSAASIAQEAASVAQAATNSCQTNCGFLNGKGNIRKCRDRCGDSCRTACSNTYPGNSNAKRSCVSRCN